MIILDSNIWIAFFHDEDTLKTKADEVFNQINNETIIVPEYVIIETATILSQNVSKEFADQFIEHISNSYSIKILSIDEYLFKEILEFYTKTINKHLSFIDISLLYLSRTHKVITFDKKLHKAINSLPFS